MTLEQLLNSDPPPESIDSADVELLALTLARYTGPGQSGQAPPLRFMWHRPDRVQLEYFRWVDDDGERYYLWPEFSRRSGLQLEPEQPGK